MTASSRKNLSTALALTGIVVGMVLLSFAAVPLYRLFCQVTGYGGTTMAGAAPTGEIFDREITIRFNADISPQLAWEFVPVQKSITAKVGESQLVFYRAKNLSDKPITGTATFNVTPHQAGQHFVKVQCFCFEEQLLQPGESLDMPVSLYLDPKLMQDENMDGVNTITLSYTFFPVNPS